MENKELKTFIHLTSLEKLGVLKAWEDGKLEIYQPSTKSFMKDPHFELNLFAIYRFEKEPEVGLTIFKDLHLFEKRKILQALFDGDVEVYIPDLDYWSQFEENKSLDFDRVYRIKPHRLFRYEKNDSI